jgi:hypothetical protein
MGAERGFLRPVPQKPGEHSHSFEGCAELVLGEMIDKSSVGRAGDALSGSLPQIRTKLTVDCLRDLEHPMLHF